MIKHTSKLDADSARALARVVIQIRPDWTTTGVANTLWQLRDQPADLVATAAILAATDPDIDTPAGIAWTDRPHWAKAAAATTSDDQARDDADTRCHQQLARQLAHELAHRATPDQIRAIRQGLKP